MEITIAIAITVGVTQVIKKAFDLPSRYAPILSLVLGIGIIFLGDLPFKESLFTGIIIGLSASGLYSGTKATVKG